MRGLAIALLTTSVLAAACGGDHDAGDATDRSVELKVGVLPIADVAPLYLGIDKGFYEDERLMVKPQVMAGGAAILPPVVSGDFQFGFSNVVSPSIARARGLPIRIVAAGSEAGDDDSKILVARDSPIRRPQDLEGKRIAVNTLNNIGTVTISHALARAGVDASTLKFAEIDFPDMQAALEARRVDAIWEKEPFITRAEREGARAIVNPYTATAPRLAIGVYFASARYVEANPDVVDRFVRATRKALAYAESHPAEVRRAVTRYTRVPPAIAKAMDLPHWSPRLNARHIRLLAGLAVEYGLAKSTPSLAELVHAP